MAEIAWEKLKKEKKDPANSNAGTEKVKTDAKTVYDAKLLIYTNLKSAADSLFTPYKAAKTLYDNKK